MTAIVAWDDKQLSLIRNTVAKDASPDEFRQFVHICRHTELDPLRRQAYCFVFHKDDAAKRQMVPVIAIAGFRSIAARTNCYRPDNRAPRIEYDENLRDLTNPLGIVRAEVSVFQFSHGQWFEVVGEAYWEEYAPIVTIGDDDDYIWQDTGEVWPDSGKPKRRKVLREGANAEPRLDPKKPGWIKMPRIMIAKCAEAQALRRAWPDSFSAIYEESEIDRTHSLDAWAAAEKGAMEARVEAIGTASGILIDWMDNKPLEGIPAGQFGDRAISFIRSNKDEPAFVMAWAEKNRHGLQQYWSQDKDGALSLKQELELVSQSLQAEAAE